jgi:hypothetical protein
MLLRRETFTEKSTIGRLFINGRFICYTLEDVVRAPGIKIKKQTAIDEGCYNVRLTMSNRFKRVLPIIDNVPNFSGIRIHGGNFAKNTEGCILVGTNKGKDVIWGSSKELREILKELSGYSQIFLSIHNCP